MFKWVALSRKQRMLFNWWRDDSPVKGKQGIIADGAIRSGKTVAMAVSFVIWGMTNFDRQNFIMAGKTVKSFQRNVLKPLQAILPGRGYSCRYLQTDGLLRVSKGLKTNDFYVFGGKDEASQDLVQGLTAAGAYFDEVALMPESFVNQATGRLSVDGSKMWFNSNPEAPLH